MSIKIKNLTVKNFLSVGNVSQAIDFDHGQLTLVLGENLDTGGSGVGSGSGNGSGKSQPVSGQVLTPYGWRRIGDLSVGDPVIAADGSTTKVTGVYPQGTLRTYRVTLADGRTTRASADHLWCVYNSVSSKTSQVITTAEIAESVPRIFLPLPAAVNFESASPSVYPFIAGAVFSGNCTVDDNTVTFLSLSGDLANLKNHIENYHSQAHCNIQSQLLVCNLGETTSEPHPIVKLKSQARIPREYMFASVEQRKELVRGFLTVSCVPNIECCLSGVVEGAGIAEDLANIVRSLGTTASVKANTSKTFTVTVPHEFVRSLFFSESAPLSVNRLAVTSVDDDVAEECVCIAIAHPSKLYITDNFVVTHNTTVVNALSYAIYGQALTNIKKDNLINNINKKNMLVTVALEKNGVEYRIERGRKPNILKYYVNGKEQDFSDVDESQGDSRETQKAIDGMIGMSHDMFKHLVALNTYTEPFLSMRAADQRVIIEQLLGITLLSEKAEKLKEIVRSIKEEIATENTKIEAVKAANDRVLQSISSLERKKKIWDDQRARSVEDLKVSIQTLQTIDIDRELELQRELEIWSKKKSQRDNLKSTIARQQSAVAKEQKTLAGIERELAALSEHKCHACGQKIHDDQHTSMLLAKQSQRDECTAFIATYQQEIDALLVQLAELGEDCPSPEVIYDSLEQALDHKNTLATLEKELQSKLAEVNPFDDQIADLQNTALQEISWDQVNELTKFKEHHEFLLKLLTSKDSFIRKRIIDQNLVFLNQRLTYYLHHIGLPHVVEFQNDLSVRISQLGQDLDFDNLSRGERNRLILSLSWAFRDVWENNSTPINLLIIDELIDNGLDASGVEASIALLKWMVRERSKSVFLVSHRNELTSRVNSVLKVVKEAGFTNYASEAELI